MDPHRRPQQQQSYSPLDSSFQSHHHQPSFPDSSYEHSLSSVASPLPQTRYRQPSQDSHYPSSPMDRDRDPHHRFRSPEPPGPAPPLSSHPMFRDQRDQRQPSPYALPDVDEHGHYHSNSGHGAYDGGSPGGYDSVYSASYNPQDPSNRLSVQPSYSVANLPYSFEHAHPAPEVSQHDFHSAGGLYPEEHRDDYHNGPYQPNAPESYPLDNYPYDNDYRGDERPILSPVGLSPTPVLNPYFDDLEGKGYFPEPIPSPAPTSVAGGPKRWKTVKKVALYKGNLVLDCPVPKKLLQMLPRKNEREFTHMRYTAATCDPSKFYEESFTLRQQLFQKPRHTELFIVVTMYNEDDVLFARTMAGVFKNIHYLCTRTRSKTWGNDAWKKVVVCIVSDGRGKINPRTRSVLAGMGCYQEGIAKTEVNEKEVTAHIYEYTTQVGVELQDKLVKLNPGGKNTTPVQILFCLKEQNQKKINSHRWFFQAFGPVLKPNVCVLIDAGTKPSGTSIYHLWKAFEVNPQCAGACGEIKAMLGKGGRHLINPLVATQNFEYKMSNILDKPLESAFGFISVLPGAFSAYRFSALQNDAKGEGPLEKYFKGEKMHGSDAGIFTANMYLAEDRILCFELVTKRNSHWVLCYVKSSKAETDVPDEISELIMQRRRWLNGSFFAAIYALVHTFDVWRSNHSFLRKIAFHIEFIYSTISMLFSWFAIGNFFLVFRILTVSLADDKMLGTAGQILSVIFEWVYLGILVTCFVLSLGNTPSGSRGFYRFVVIWWAVIMAYLMFAAIFISVKSILEQLETDTVITVSTVFANDIFRNLIVSLCSTYILYFVASFLFFEPWHMFTSFLQYLLLSPSYINVLNVYAFCNTHDVSWGTKGPDVPPPIKNGKVKATDGKADLNVPSDDKDLDEQYESEMRKIAAKAPKEEEKVNDEQKQKNYYSGVRSGVVLFWIFTNFALAAAVLNSGGLDRLVEGNEETIQASRSRIYLGVILWSVAGLSAFRFLGCIWFLIVRMFRGV